MRDYWAGSLRRTPRLAVSIGACLRISHRLHASVHLSIADILITIDLRKVTILFLIRSSSQKTLGYKISIDMHITIKMRKVT